MPLAYDYTAIPETDLPKADAAHQHIVDIYAGETNKVISVWRDFSNDQLDFRPHPRSTPVGGIFQHQLLSERRFFGEFLGSPEPPAAETPPAEQTVEAFCARMKELAAPRLEFLASREQDWWLERAKFFDVERERIWIFWRRILHTAHHRTQLTGYLRLLDRPVPATYGPTADVTWEGADPTLDVRSAERK